MSNRRIVVGVKRQLVGFILGSAGTIFGACVLAFGYAIQEPILMAGGAAVVGCCAYLAAACLA